MKILLIYTSSSKIYNADLALFHFLRFAHFRYAKCLFRNVKKQYSALKSSLLFKKNTNM